ncbi:acyltransferase family protein [Glaciecola sp. 2405UD65-10]|uniref:acyltransferase family protein n=1 Tax=Glaciecola sp. 2405UD65-10 TaxID=3397244 RepID=UPI003B5B9DD4
MDARRVTELDGLRGIAAIAVVLYHYFYYYDVLYSHSFTIPEAFRFGMFGVHLFFMISGFVIFWSISSSNKVSDFIKSRFKRLYPTFWAAAILTFVVLSMFPLPNVTLDAVTLLVNLSMLHQYFGFKHIDGVYWTLTLELSFYFWIVCIVIVNQLKRIDQILIVWLVVSISLAYSNFEVDRLVSIFFLLDYISFFAAGICFYKLKNKIHNNYTLALMLLTIFAIFQGYSLKQALGLTFFYVVFFLIIKGKAILLNHKVLVYFGSISYALYLIHQNIGYVIISKFYEYKYDPFWGIAVAIIISIVLAHALCRWVEKPSALYLKKLFAK